MSPSGGRGIPAAQLARHLHGFMQVNDLIGDNRYVNEVMALFHADA